MRKFAAFSGDQSPATVTASLNASPLIEYAEPKYSHTIAAIPNDSLYHHQESYYNIIKAPQTRDVVKGEDRPPVENPDFIGGRLC